MVAWVMVLIRLRYFRQHIIARHRKKTLLQSFRDRFTNMTSTIGASIPHKHVEDGDSAEEKHHKHGSNGVQASDGIGAALAGTTTGLGLGLAFKLGTDGDKQAAADPGLNVPASPHSNESSAHVRVDVESPDPLSSSMDLTMHFDEDHDHDHDHDCGIMHDVQSFTSSPRSGAMPLPQSPRSPPPQHLQFAPDPRQAGTGVMRRRGKVSPDAAVDATLSLTAPPYSVPQPRRRTVLMPKIESTSANKHVLGQRPKDQGLGGFPGPFQLSARLARKYFPHVYKRLVSMTSITQPKAGSAKWLTESLGGLIIGRNSDFNTEELSDDQLEELGGIESVLALAYVESGSDMLTI